MDKGTPMAEASPHYDSDLPELGTVPLREVMELDESVLAQALRRVWHEADHPEEVLAGFTSSI
jgi:FXSXX-COOH protein